MSRLGLAKKGFVLATVHRQENTDDTTRLRAIFEGLATVAEDIPVILPLHPRTRARLDGNRIVVSRDIRIVEPLGFLDMLALEQQAAVIATDSGGVQKEAYFQRVPCVTLRDETEWTELVETGWNRICPPLSSRHVSSAILRAISTVGDDVAIYGDGEAAALIVDRLSRAT